MLELALIGSTALLGVAGMAHCTAMCGAACAALTGGGAGAGGARGQGASALARGDMRAALPLPAGLPGAAASGAARAGTSSATWGFHMARVGSYAAGGAVAAASMGALAALAQWSPALRPFWTLLHAAALALGLFLLWRGRQPGWMSAIGRQQRSQPAVAGGWQRVHLRQRLPLKAVAAGSLWVAWPCGLLQSALLVAAMASSPWGGALAMAAFAVTSSGGLLLAPWAWRRWGARPGAQAGAVRLAGALLAGASGFALLHGLWPAFAAFCAAL